MWLLRMLLVALVLYIPYQQYFSAGAADGGIRGVNVMNVMFIAIVGTMLLLGVRARTPAPLRGSFLLLFAALIWGTLVGQVYDSTAWVADFTVLKNALLFMLLYFVYYHACRDVTTVRMVFAAILAIAALAAVQAVRQALDYGIGNYSETHRAAGPFAPDYSGANRAAVYFCIFLPVFAAVAFYFRSRPAYRAIALAGAALLVFATFFTYSRQAYFILAVLAVLMTLRRSVLLGALAVVALLSYQSWVPQPVLDRIEMTEQLDERGETQLDSSTESRFIVWEGAWQLMQDRPWGIGLNHFKREIGFVSDLREIDAHNHFVLMATETGFVGLAAMCWLIVGLAGLGWRLRRDGADEAQLLGTGFLFAVLAMVLGNLYGSRFLDGDVMGNFWILAALVARYTTLRAEEQRGAPVATLPLVDRGGYPAPQGDGPYNPASGIYGGRSNGRFDRSGAGSGSS